MVCQCQHTVSKTRNRLAIRVLDLKIKELGRPYETDFEKV